jgi:type II secretory pathway component PulF
MALGLFPSGLASGDAAQRSAPARSSKHGRWRVLPRIVESFACRRRSGRPVTVLLHDLSMLLSVGVRLHESLELLVPTLKGRLQEVVLQVFRDVNGGCSFADAMRRHPSTFDGFVVAAVTVAEQTGTLGSALQRVAAQRESGERLRSKMMSSMLYPAIVAVVGFSVTLVLMTIIAPALFETIVQAGKPLPLITQVVKGACDGLREYWPVFLLGALLGSGLMLWTLRVDWVRVWIDHRLHRVPFIGSMLQTWARQQICGALAVLLRNGFTFSQALAIVRAAVANRAWKGSLDRIALSVRAGSSVARATSLEVSLFGPVAARVLAVGEVSGELADALERLSADAESRLKVLADRMPALIEPVLIVFLSLGVGVVALAIILPIMEATHDL